MCFARMIPTSMRAILQRLFYGLATAGFVLLCAASLAAQGGSIRGRLFLPGGATLNEATRISLETSRGVKATVFTDNQGQFNFPGLTPGTYQVIIEGDRSRFETTTANIEVFPNAPALLNIVLREKKVSKAMKGGENSVSVAELDADVPAKAKKEFERASSAAEQGKTAEAIAHLRQAITIYPRYLMAHNDLGAQLLGQGKLEEAAEELHKALEIDSKAFNPHLNLGIVLVQQHKFSEAEAMLKVAVSLNAGSPSARMYNGIALEGLNIFDEAERELKAAHELGGSDYAKALFHLGQVYMNTGQLEKAVTALKSYLREAPSGPHAQQAQTLLGTLK
jgi:Flp pilus assembly protein TadD